MSPNDDFQEPSDGIDFKPFFDMIVGVLFVLLVIISGQIYQSRFHASDSDDTKALRADIAKLRQENAALRKENAGLKASLESQRVQLSRGEVQAFLEALKKALDAKGLQTAASLADGRISIRLDRLIGEVGALQPRREGITALANVLEGVASCLTPGQRPANCPAGLPAGVLALDVETGKGLPAGVTPLALSQIITGRLIEAEPALAAMTGLGGRAILPREGHAGESEGRGWLHLVAAFQ